jgi:hypothetical protein
MWRYMRHLEAGWKKHKRSGSIITGSSMTGTSDPERSYRHISFYALVEPEKLWTRPELPI